MAIIEVGGAQTVGKTTTISLARDLATKEVRVLKRSTIMAQILGVNEEELRSCPPDALVEARTQMQEQIDAEDNYVRDSHFAVFDSNGGYNFPYRVNDIGRVALLVLITSQPEEIARRRKTIKRERSIDIDIIKRQLALENEGAEILATRLNAPLVLISNDDHGNFASAQILAKYFDEYLA